MNTRINILIKNPHLNRVVVLIISFLLVYLRNPIYFINPRFWAEEGTVYFQHAFSNHWYASLFYSPQGYFGLPASFATTIAAHFFRLEAAPYATTFTALVIQLIPFAIILWSQSPYWNGWLRKLIGMGIILFAPYSNEIWLNTVNSQFYLVVVTFLILLEPANSGRIRQWIERALLILAGLTGIVPCVLLPLFFYKWYVNRHRERFIRATILLFCLAIQIVVALTTSNALSFNSRISHSIDLGTLISTILTRSIAPIFLGLNLSTRIAHLINPSPGLGSPGILASILVLLLVIIIFGWLFRSLQPQDRILFLGAFLLLVCVSNLFAVGSAPKTNLIIPGYSPRYFYAANVILMFAIFVNLNLEEWRRKKLPQLFLSGLVIWSLALGGYNYFANVTASPDWPVWSQEVAKWRTDSSYKLQIWPPGWQVDLNKPG